MKIVQVVHSFEPTSGGMESAVYSLSMALGKLGHDVTVITTQEKGKLDYEVINGVKVKRIWSLHFPLFSSIRFSPGLLRLVLDTDADVIHAHGYATPHSFFAGLAAVLKHTPFVFTFHGYHRFRFGVEWMFHSAYKLLLAPLFFSWTQKVISVAAATVPLIKGQVRESKIVIIPNGVDTETARCIDATKLRAELASGDGPVITYVGRLDKYKGIDTLIEAFAKLKKDFPSAALVISGRDEGIGKDLRQLAESFGVAPIFTFHPSDKMSELYSASDVVVLPSRYEGLSLVVLETIACGKPIITTPTGDSEKVLKEAYGKAAGDFIFPIGDSNSLYQKCCSVLKNKKRYEKMLENGSKYLIQNYSWDSVAKRTVDVYKNVMKK